ncbi:MOSC domain-containing protein [Lacihabitans sp. CCS-44]|uniref:MOSC domain-containing protein n=1 Tax=Lacihabitans sp. CCS-44 TaxID=2487331 RepID=UPI0020CB7024|nr:MOSC N-terminal beta barrel domain-containing protein [Lacihabitans sp. CCS-44]MCP9754364.1 MOSC domain-containing protein [Lacihabitans sp. CCS-44]
MEISQLFIYPIKSLGGISLQESKVDVRGLEFDRRWMLVSENDVFLTQRDLPKLAAFFVSLNAQGLTVVNKNNQNKINVPFYPKSGIKKVVKVWDDEILAEIVDETVSAWFSNQLGVNVNLVFQPDDTIRLIDKKYMVSGEEQTSFSDGYPILILSEASLDLLNTKSIEKIPLERFRPNVIIKNCAAFFEDTLKQIKINDTQLYGVKRCSRCMVTTIDQNTYEITKEPLFTLSKFRKFENKIMFGQNVVVHKSGTIKIGDKIT